MWRSVCCVCLIGLLVPRAGSADCQAWSVDAEASRLGFTAVQADAEFDGQFRRFHADICFSADSLQDSRFDVRVDPASADTRNSERDEVLLGPDFFAVTRFPEARFVAGDFIAAAGGAYVARGELSLRGVTLPLSVPFRLTGAAEGGEALLSGEVPLSRLAFGIGQGEWQDTTWVGDEVRVRFALRLLPQADSED